MASLGKRSEGGTGLYASGLGVEEGTLVEPGSTTTERSPGSVRPYSEWAIWPTTAGSCNAFTWADNC